MVVFNYLASLEYLLNMQYIRYFIVYKSTPSISSLLSTSTPSILVLNIQQPLGSTSAATLAATLVVLQQYSSRIQYINLTVLTPSMTSSLSTIP